MSRIKPLKKRAVEVTQEDCTIVIKPNDGAPDDLEFAIENVPNPSGELTVFMEVSAGGREEYVPGSERVLRVNTDRPSPPGTSQWHLSWIGHEPFTAVFYYHGLQTASVDLFVRLEGNESLRLHRIEAYAHPDTVVREFDHGLVLANPSPRRCRFDLEAVFPGQRFRRLKGSFDQDPVTNDGSEVNGIVELGGKDALFLVKDHSPDAG